MAAVVLSSGVVVARAQNLIYSAIGLLFTFFGIAGIFVFAHADFVAGIQVVVYVGGILVLVLFGIMLTRRKGGVKVPNEITGSWAERLVPALVTILLLTVVLSVDWQGRFSDQTQNPNLWSSYDADAPASIQERRKSERSARKKKSNAEDEANAAREDQSASGNSSSEEQDTPRSWGTIDSIGGVMMNKYLVAFEEISVLLLVALLGAVYLARRPSEEDLEEARQAMREMEEDHG